MVADVNAEQTRRRELLEAQVLDLEAGLSTQEATAEAGYGRMAEDFAAFTALNDLPMGMTAHLVYDALDDKPATLSPTVMRLIREKLGFDNLIMTDDIAMKALKGSLAEISAAALKAGCDVILHCNGTLADRREVAEAAGMTVERSFYFNSFLFPVVVAIRGLKALFGRDTPDDDLPGPVMNRLLSRVFRTERHLVGTVAMPFSSLAVPRV